MPSSLHKSYGRQACKSCSQAFEITDDEVAFLKKMEFRFGDVSVCPPSAVFCPDCRLRNRTCHRNEQYLYRRESSLSKKPIVSLYHPDSPFVVYSQEEWRSDAFDPLQYGQPYDETTSFFTQFTELQKKVPRVALVTVDNENSDFTTGTGYCKNCYLINSSEYSEDCYYGKLFQRCRDCMDSAYVYDCELCYECFSVSKSYGCAFLSQSQNCQECFFGSNLQSCKHCFLCTNLSRKEYCIENEQYTKEEYEERVRGILDSKEAVEASLARLDALNAGKIHRFANIVNAEGCTGDYIEDSKNCTDCYDMNGCEDCRFVTVGVQTKDSYDCSNMYLKPELCYETLGTIEAHTVAYCLYMFHSQRMLYCDTCYSSSDCFGCIGLTRRKYCILNTEYSKEEYDALVPRIIERMKQDGEWGRFFPPETSTFAFNESLASEYFPMEKDAAMKLGLWWREKDPKEFLPTTFVLPDRTSETPDSVTKETLACEDCGRNYKIIPQELSFLKKNGIRLPRRCPTCRQAARMRLRNPRKLWTRPCGKCGAEMRTTYAPDRPEIVYCERCYLETVY